MALVSASASSDPRFATTKAAALAAVLVLACCRAAAPARAQQCGSQAGGAVCSGGLCCSQFGYCGLGGDYCGSGCQSGPCYIVRGAAAAAAAPVRQEQCGSQAGGAVCPGGLCCSQFGYCGLGGDYCGAGCQSGPCYIVRGAAAAAAVVPVKQEQCGSQAGGAVCPGGLCCSQFGYCGLGGDYCGAGCQSGPCYIVRGAATAAAAPVKQEQCGSQAGGAVCPGGLCCSQFGYCGLGGDYCGAGCQSGPCYTVRGVGAAAVVTRDLFDRMLPHRDDSACPAHGFYTYDAFVAAARAFPAFAATGDADARKREVAAFLAHTSHETSGGPYSWGFCYKEVQGATSSFCVPSAQWPCAPNKTYHARGPMQISYNYNYGPAGQAIGADLLNNPDLVATDPVVAFKTALWLWMTPRAPAQPSCHAVATGQWAPAPADVAAGRKPGYGLTTNILTGGLHCSGSGAAASARVAFYKRYCDVLGLSYGPNVECRGQAPFDGAIMSSAQ